LCEGPYRGADLAHQGGGVHVVSGDVAENHGGLMPGQGERVVEVAAGGVAVHAGLVLRGQSEVVQRR
jgi:hypothetical protein